MIRTHDSGGLDGFGKTAKWVRYDHNIFYNATNFLAIGIYVDFGGEQIIDHNLFWNIDRPVQMNQNTQVGYTPIKVYNNTAFADVLSKPGIFNGVGNWGPNFDVRNNIMSGNINAGPAGSIVRSNLSVLSTNEQTSLFTDQTLNDYTLKSSAVTAIDKGEILPFAYPLSGAPDLGCYEYGVEPWKAGAGNLKPEFILTDTIMGMVVASSQTKTWKFPVHALAFCGFTGDIALSLSAVSEGITASLSSGTVAPNGKVELTITAINIQTPIETIQLTGISGEYVYVRTFAVTVLPVLTKLDISPGITEAKTGDIIQFTATPKDQFGAVMDPKPFITWTISGGGTILNGKFKATVASEKVSIIASSQGISDTVEFKVVSLSVGINNPEGAINKIYPNPAYNEINLAVYSITNQNVTLFIFNSLSKICIIKPWELQAGENNQQLTIGELPEGLYLMKLSSEIGENLGSCKFIKK